MLTFAYFTTLYIDVLRKEKEKKKPPPKKSNPMLQLSITLEDVQEQPTYKRFNVCLDAALETVEDMDISTMKGTSESEIDRIFIK